VELSEDFHRLILSIYSHQVTRAFGEENHANSEDLQC
jgi:hypothetical protein